MFHTIKSSDDVVAFVMSRLDTDYKYLKNLDKQSIESEILCEFDAYYDDFLDSVNELTIL